MMATTSTQSEPSSSVQAVPGDLVALVSSIVIVVAYLLFPLRVDGSATGFGFIDSGTTFPALTLVVGVAGIIAAVVNMIALRGRAARWYIAGLGFMGLIFVVDNAQRGKPSLALGGLLAMIGCAGLVIQAALPRPGYTAGNRTHEIIL